MTARRSARESSIHKDEQGRWHGYVTIGVRPDGSRDRRHREGATRAEVVAKIKELEQGRDAGVVTVAGKNLTVGEWMDQWLLISAARVRPKTLGGYEMWVRRYVQPAFGSLRLDRLQPEHLETLYAQMRRKGLAPASALKVHRILHRALTVALQRGYVGRNVAKLVDAPRVPHEEIVPLSSEEARALIQQAQGLRNGARWTVALALGLRQGEVLGAQWRDVDLEAGTWRVRRQLQRHVYKHGCTEPCGADRAMRCPERIGGAVFTEPKSEKGKRTLGIPTQLLDQLRSHRAQQLEERLAAANVWDDGDLVFAQPNGRPIDSRRDWKDWKQLLASAGVRDARLHDARHTAATLLLEQGVDVRIVMEVLGHANVQLTQNTYQHVMPRVIAAATQGVADHLFAREATGVELAPPRRRGR